MSTWLKSPQNTTLASRLILGEDHLERRQLQVLRLVDDDELPRDRPAPEIGHRRQLELVAGDQLVDGVPGDVGLGVREQSMEVVVDCGHPRGQLVSQIPREGTPTLGDQPGPAADKPPPCGNGPARPPAPAQRPERGRSCPSRRRPSATPRRRRGRAVARARRADAGSSARHQRRGDDLRSARELPRARTGRPSRWRSATDRSAGRRTR